MSKAIEHLRSLVRFAYEHGYHELGYDPVQEVESRLDEALADARYWRVTAGDVDGELKKATGRIDAQALEAATLRNQEIEYQDTDDENERLKSRLDKIIQSRDALKGEARGYFEQVQLAERREHDLLQRIERLRDWIQERADADCPYGEPDFEACGHNRKHGICASHAAAKVLAQDTFVSDAPVVERPRTIGVDMASGPDVTAYRCTRCGHIQRHPLVGPPVCPNCG